MKSVFTKLGLFAFLALIMFGCYPGGAEYTSDTDLVYTNYDDQFDFNKVHTYFMSDSIFHAVDEGEDPDYTYDEYIISELARNFDALGYTRLTANDSTGPKPDVMVVVTVSQITNYNVYAYPWYPGWGWGWYWKDSDYYGYPGYGWGYPWYGTTYVTSYTVGTVLWDMFDPDKVDQDNEVINVQWTGAVNGVMGSSSVSTKERITDGINQAFQQSPYLQGE